MYRNTLSIFPKKITTEIPASNCFHILLNMSEKVDFIKQATFHSLTLVMGMKGHSLLELISLTNKNQLVFFNHIDLDKIHVRACVFLVVRPAKCAALNGEGTGSVLVNHLCLFLAAFGVCHFHARCAFLADHGGSFLVKGAVICPLGAFRYTA